MTNLKIATAILSITQTYQKSSLDVCLKSCPVSLSLKIRSRFQPDSSCLPSCFTRGTRWWSRFHFHCWRETEINWGPEIYLKRRDLIMTGGEYDQQEDLRSHSVCLWGITFTFQEEKWNTFSLSPASFCFTTSCFTVILRSTSSASILGDSHFHFLFRDHSNFQVTWKAAKSGFFSREWLKRGESLSFSTNESNWRWVPSFASQEGMRHYFLGRRRTTDTTTSERMESFSRSLLLINASLLLFPSS